MFDYLRQIWRCRYFWYSMVKMDLRNRYRRSALGIGWSLLHPILMTIILSVVFANIFHVDITVFAPMVLSGLAVWSYIVNSASNGCHCFLSGEAYIRQYPIPLAVYPLRVSLGGMIHFLIALTVVAFATCVLKGTRLSALPVLSMVPTILLLFLFTWSLAILTGFANVYFQDTQHLTEVCFQMLFYITPIMYTDEVFAKLPCAWLFGMNPVLPFLRLIREPLLNGAAPTLLTYGYAAMVVSLAMGFACYMLRRYHQSLIFHL